jgi:antitoxin (DNA-binding transcriptional repressor) of toxin-antitoxin stability system
MVVDTPGKPAMTTMSLAEAQRNLSHMARRLSPGEEVVNTENDEPVARLTASPPRLERKLGSLKGYVLYMAPDFDAPLEDFKEYME